MSACFLSVARAHSCRYFNTAAQLAGPTIIGLNRQLNKLNLTIAAATVAVSKMSNLFAFELGNEPNCECLTSI